MSQTLKNVVGIADSSVTDSCLYLRMSKIQYNAVTNSLSTLDCGIYALGQLHNAKFGLLFGLVGKQKAPNFQENFAQMHRFEGLIGALCDVWRTRCTTISCTI